MRMRNQSGFTVAEVLVAVGLCAVAILGTFNVLSYFKLQYNRSFLKTDSNLSVTLGERFLYSQFKNAFPSFNNLTGLQVMDDFNKNFYDLNLDYPVNLMPEADRIRQFTMEPTGKTVFYVITTNSQESPPLFIDPVQLFNVGPTNGQVNGSLLYAGFTNNNYIQKLSAKEQKPGSNPIWRDRNILYLYLPTTIRIPNLVDPTQDAIPVSPYCFFGQVAGNDMNLQNFGGLVNCRNPMDGQPILSVQSFMQNMPSQQGGVPMVLLRSVSVLRYQLVSSPSTPSNFDFIFDKWDGTGFSQPQTAATNIIKVQFKRHSISDTVISITVIPKEVK